MIATTIDCKIGTQNVYIAIFGCRSLSQSAGVSCCELGVVENPRFAVGIVILSVIVPEMYVFPVLGPHCHFRFIIIVAVTWRHFIQARHGQKSRTCRWNFDSICCSSSGITISGSGGHVAISSCLRCYSHLLILSASSSWSKTLGLPWNCNVICHNVGLGGHVAIFRCPSMSHLFLDTFFEFGVVINFVFRARINSNTYFRFIRLCESVTMTMCSRWWPITTSGFIRRLENVQIPLFILVPSHPVSLPNIQKYHICEVYIFAL